MEARGGTLSADRLTIFFFSNRGGTVFRIWAATRSTPLGGFSSPLPVGIPGSLTGQDLIYPWWLDAQHLFIGAYSAVYRATWDGTAFTLASELTELTPFQPGSPMAIAGENLIVFSGHVSGKYHIYEARRAGGPTYQTPRLVDELQGATDEFPKWISADGCRIYFVRSGAPELLVSDRKK